MMGMCTSSVSNWMHGEEKRRVEGQKGHHEPAQGTKSNADKESKEKEDA